MTYDYAIVGGGIIGLTSAWAIARRFPEARIIVVEKESGWALHQSGRNSGVIHSGIYYKPGSLKAKFAHEGHRSMIRFCGEHGIAHEVCGKVIVATLPKELPGLEKLLTRGRANGVHAVRIDSAQLKDIEPHVTGLAAILVRETGIVDYKEVCQTLVNMLKKSQVELRLNTLVNEFKPFKSGLQIGTTSEDFQARFFVNCTGLQSDRVAKLAHANPQARIVPFRGEYYCLRPDRKHLVRNLVYPVPDPAFPFLGVHLTRTIAGEIHAGPNAVLACHREGYCKTDFATRDFVDTMSFPGFWRLARRHWAAGFGEFFRSINKKAFVRRLQRLLPAVNEDDLVPAPAGVRAQALRRDGQLIDDFLIVPSDRGLHVCNAPSPAATASLEIGQHIASLVPRLN